MGKMKTHILTWGNGHKLYREDYEYLKLLAEQKAFYFSNVRLDGVLINIKL